MQKNKEKIVIGKGASFSQNRVNHFLRIYETDKIKISGNQYQIQLDINSLQKYTKN